MKKVDIKSFLIGVLVTTNLFFITGFTSSNTNRQVKHPLISYDIEDVVKRVDDVLTRVRKIGITLRNIENKVGHIEGDVLVMKYGVDCN